eukprot:12018751-Heterocapsa_arctica.AAC.1
MGSTPLTLAAIKMDLIGLRFACCTRLVIGSEVRVDTADNLYPEDEDVTRRLSRAGADCFGECARDADESLSQRGHSQVELNVIQLVLRQIARNRRYA